MLCVVLRLIGPSVGFKGGVEPCNGASPEALGGVNKKMCVVDGVQPVGVPERQEDLVPSVFSSNYLFCHEK